MTREEIRAYAERLVDDAYAQRQAAGAPPPTGEQLARLAALLPPPRAGGEPRE